MSGIRPPSAAMVSSVNATRSIALAVLGFPATHRQSDRCDRFLESHTPPRPLAAGASTVPELRRTCPPDATPAAVL